MKKCRVCSNNFFDQPLLNFEDMPKAAQYLPDEKLLAKDKGVNLEVCQCSSCGLVQLNNEPVPYYKEVIRAVAVSAEMKSFRKKQFGGFIDRFSLKGKRIIEIGCGRGEYLSLIGEAGADAYGLEQSKEAVSKCIENGLKVSKGFIEDKEGRISNSPFDAFFILSFLEHLPDPNSTLQGIGNNLVDEGLGVVEVPNFDMILRNNLFSEFIGDHLLYFTKETLSSTLRLNGFEIIECKEIWHDYIISAIVRKKKKLDVSHFYDYQERLKKEINEYIKRFKDNKVAIWGAGHQALAVMSLTKLAGKVKYIIDSASFKQGKFSPATHIPIVVPDMLMQEAVDAIIVMAASYSDEVVKIIREKYDRDIQIAVLRDFGLEII